MISAGKGGRKEERKEDEYLSMYLYSKRWVVRLRRGEPMKEREVRSADLHGEEDPYSCRTMPYNINISAN